MAAIPVALLILVFGIETFNAFGTIFSFLPIEIAKWLCLGCFLISLGALGISAILLALKKFQSLFFGFAFTVLNAVIVVEYAAWTYRYWHPG